MILADTHCHLDFSRFDADRGAVLERAWDAGLERILVPGIDLGTSRAAIKLADSQPRVYAAIGMHPNSSPAWDGRSLGDFKTLAKSPKVVAIGEIGLDYYRDRAPRHHQQGVFREQLNLAGQLDLPVVIHVRNGGPEDRACIQDLIAILREWQPTRKHSGVVHSYSGNPAEAEILLEMGFFLGITGPVTFKKAVELQQVVAQVPLDRLLIETDAPYLTPHPYRGKRNEPAHVRYVAERIAEIKACSPKIVAETTSANARRLFGWG